MITNWIYVYSHFKDEESDTQSDYFSWGHGIHEYNLWDILSFPDK